MKRMIHKLRSRAGESMILAMVFMLFCSFVGGSVLASATANAQRVAQIAEQQDFLLERSAALMLSDQIQLEPGQAFRLNVLDSDRTIKEVTVTGGGVVEETGNSKKERLITFQLTSTVNSPSVMQRLMVETTILRYLMENIPGETDPVVVALVNYPNQGDNLVSEDFLSSQPGFLFTRDIPLTETTDYKVEGSMSISGTTNGSTLSALPNYTAYFSSGRGEELFDFFVDFGEESQLKMAVNAYSGSANPITVVNPAVEEDPGNPYFAVGGTIQVTAEIKQTMISWDDPKIEKGGAA